jgi:hypothetical protein
MNAPINPDFAARVNEISSLSLLDYENTPGLKEWREKVDTGQTPSAIETAEPPNKPDDQGSGFMLGL